MVLLPDMKTLLLIYCFCFLSVAVCAQNAKIDSLKKVIETTAEGETQGTVWVELSECFLYAKAYNNGLTAAQKALKQLDPQKNPALWAVALYFKARNLFGLARYPEAQQDFQKAIVILNKYGDHRNILPDALNRVGLIYDIQGNYAQALKYYFDALRLGEKNGNPNTIAYIYSNIGNIYLTQQQFNRALAYYQKSLQLEIQLKDSSGIAGSYNNIGIVYYYKGDIPRALDYYNRSLLIRQSLKDSSQIALLLGNIGGIYFGENNYNKALDYFYKSLTIREQMNDSLAVASMKINIAKVYNITGRHIEAKQLGREALATATRLQVMDLIKEISQSIYQSDSALGDWKSAFEYHKLFKQYSDSLHNEDKAKEFGRIESRYQFEKEAEEAKRKQAEAQRKEQLETERRNNLQYLSIFAGLMILFGGLAFVGKLKIPARVLDIVLFAALLILFEFLLILFDPILDEYTGGIPIQKLIFNSVIALGFAPLHGFLEKKLRRRMSSNP
jgi:tetratricopeptide (TPR) repeat protein